ncbi:hypothetical protein MAM1_0440c10520 [Mucor ambiguus]|uniref:Uncharacterized protein n=1 Tax=Mucor ambiguus TaxID=91626 RepID=A0A0C9LYD7_9FUNG|nr:hypothetical protein MAM1_0440c10520 [Mucor ambiguus]
MPGPLIQHSDPKVPEFLNISHTLRIQHKLLVRLSRNDENTTLLRPDAATVAIPQKEKATTLGYVEVNAPGFESNPE